MNKIHALTLVLLLFTGCQQKHSKKEAQTTAIVNTSEITAPKETLRPDLPIENLRLPNGFKIDFFAANVPGARSMALGDRGTVFVGTRNENKVYALLDPNQDGTADDIIIIAEGLNTPNGVAYRNGDLYVAEISRLLRYPNIQNTLPNIPDPEVIYDDYPTEFHHGWKYIAFGPDDKLYVPVGAPCNICDSSKEDKKYASITRMNPDGSGREVFAHGVRNTVGFTWHPKTGELWFTDNGRDMMGDDIPPCELNKAPEAGMHFGYPYCHGGTIPDPEFGSIKSCNEFVQPAQQLGAHVAPLGLSFYRGGQFPNTYKNKIFIAEHGSWNRSKKVGYLVSMVEESNGNTSNYEPFIDGWLDEKTQERFGRPVDVIFLNDGSMLISDDYAGTIYRVTYKG